MGFVVRYVDGKIRHLSPGINFGRQFNFESRTREGSLHEVRFLLDKEVQ